jgi:ABC-type transport system involved in cytochrome c biogenesis permease subunit
VALLLELMYLLRPRPVYRATSIGFSAAGLLAHTLFLAAQRLPLSSRYGSLLFLAWILAVFTLYGALHHRRVAWGLFVLPLVLGLVGLAIVFTHDPTSADEDYWLSRLVAVGGREFWGAVHGTLLLLAGVGICVGFIASLMYLVHARRLTAKMLPGSNFRMLSLERLEKMNRRAIILAFPLLTAGVLVGMALLAHSEEPLHGWTDVRILTAGVLWLVFAILLYLRYNRHIGGRRVALLTIVAFVLLVVSYAVPHTLGGGGAP